MKFSTLVSLAFALVGSVSASSCTDANGYYYCNETPKFIYKNVGFPGSYRNVVSMNEDNTAVSYETATFSGPLSPFDEELSVHIRGPINLHEFAVYYPANSGSAHKKRDDDEECSTTKHVHHRHVKRATRVVTETKYVDENGHPITETAEPVPTTTSSTSSNANTANTNPAAPVAPVSSSSANVKPSPATSSANPASPASSSSSSSASTATAGAGDWIRTSHYVPGSTSNLTVLNNLGGGGSGVWSPTWGLSLSYANADNSGAASSATPLKDVTLASIKEFSLWSGLQCGDSSEEYGCGYSRPNSVAMHAFAGAEKIMVFSFTMPADESTSTEGGIDMPAIWLLNAKIPRIGQYLGISCWTSGCGELDLFEVLVNDKNKMVTALHDKQGGNGMGSSDYISRPFDTPMKAVVIFYEGEIHIQVVDSNYQFGSTLSGSQVSSWRSVGGTEIVLSS
ncbi:hypothetical protein JCM33374_g5981 [Metschnikowia sp. JCM 33374]|nr:hypothetical protein JCM33374_g5981 [Metschnikowia sp. JCM 33374]